MSPAQARSDDRRYHHGDLRRAILTAAAEAVRESGPAALSLRELARRAGVSHAAPAHHFGDKAGLLTAMAADGFTMLHAAMADAWERKATFLDVGLAYLRFALDHQPHFEVMFRPDLYRADDPEVVAGRRASAAVVYEAAHQVAATPGFDARLVGLTGWSIMHGLATLWINGALFDDVPADDPEALARLLSQYLFQGSVTSGTAPHPR